MRIRKNVSKILGLSSPLIRHHRSPPPPTPPPLQIPSPSSELDCCQLNCNPWDIIDVINPNPKEVEDEDGGIMGNGTKSEAEPINNIITSKEEEDEAMEQKKNKKRKKRAAGAGSESGSNFYYYHYSGLGPWRGIRRGGADVKVKLVADDDDDNEEEEDDGTVIAGDDEEDDDVVIGERKGVMRVIKARSLSSLL